MWVGLIYLLIQIFWCFQIYFGSDPNDVSPVTDKLSLISVGPVIFVNPDIGVS